MQTDTEKHTRTHTHTVIECNLALKLLCFSSVTWQNIQSVALTNSQSKHSEYDITVWNVVIYWYDVLNPFYNLTCSHAFYLMPITDADCFTAIGIE